MRRVQLPVAVDFCHVYMCVFESVMSLRRRLRRMMVSVNPHRPSHHSSSQDTFNYNNTFFLCLIFNFFRDSGGLLHFDDPTSTLTGFHCMSLIIYLLRQ